MNHHDNLQTGGEQEFNLKLIRVDADGTETTVRQKQVQQPEFWHDQSEQATRDERLRKQITEGEQ
jgi:hypothetical protein